TSGLSLTTWRWQRRLPGHSKPFGCPDIPPGGPAGKAAKACNLPQLSAHTKKPPSGGFGGKVSSLRFVQGFGHTGLPAIGGVLVNNALGNGTIQRGGGCAELFGSGVHVLSQQRVIFLHRGLDAGFHHAVAQI